MASLAMPSNPTPLLAVPTKEWVIQPKPKPGRKPKKDPNLTTVDDPDGKGRRVQNRAAQRAFRERKQSQLAELQARVQSYEQGEIERNVALQNIAKRLKEENELLRRENVLLKETMSRMETEHQITLDNERKRWRENPSIVTSSLSSSRKRPRIDDSSQDAITLSHIPAFSSESPPSMASSPESCQSPFSPMALDTPQQPQVPLNNLINLSLPAKLDSFSGSNSIIPAFAGCGLCSEGTSCVCRDALENPMTVASPPTTLKIEAFEAPHPPTIIRIGSPAPTTILDNLPEYKPPVPLRRRNNTSGSNLIFPVTPVPSSQKPTCSGDPANCLACADDSFGKAFCAALGKSVAAQSSVDSESSCSNCPCGPHNFGVNPAVVSLTSSPQSLSPVSTPPPECEGNADTIPTDDAWRQLKAHPNVAFADLALLADVVARRSKCTGPRVVISPAPGTVTPERVASPANGDSQAVLLTDPHAQYHKNERARSTSSPPQLVPQEILLKCGQERVREVQTAGVRDALRLLDAKFS
ncbi:hypothetical protein PM082_002894 [Marasmius tenuissimus]|nr:hypothetical protein PM082_002894 [Marasmius tenuissimus]